MAITHEVGTAIREGRFLLPVEVSLSSASDDEHLLTYLVESMEPERWGHVLHADETRWQDSDIFPVTTIIITGSEDVLKYKVDPRLKRTQ